MELMTNQIPAHRDSGWPGILCLLDAIPSSATVWLPSPIGPPTIALPNKEYIFRSYVLGVFFY
jgi:hypothetical protein